MLPSVTKAASKVLSEAIKSSNSTYKLLYFELHGRGEMARILFSYGGVKWEELPSNWATQKSQTPFQCVPVIYETTSDGTVLQIGETSVIERYLAKKFNLLGQNEWEQLQIEQFQNSTESSQLMYQSQVLKADIEKRVENTNTYYKQVVEKFINVHENHLENNGSNGFYVGDSLSLADIKTAVYMNRLLLLKDKKIQEVPFSADKSPNLWKLRENVNSNPSIAAWRSSQRYKDLDASTLKIFKL
ncbi:hypothetical protein BGZ49_003184 [Haplosporangium sp. Z 27]|nr:hypothetical protein BGZ49_003184 [Haplosporangium sp. Z 27]